MRIPLDKSGEQLGGWGKSVRRGQTATGSVLILESASRRLPARASGQADEE
jgi:hypothetical protein